MSLPYMPFWVGDYTKDTMHLNTIQHGAYLLLIFHLWTSNDPSDATSNQQVIAKALLKHCPSICKMSKSEWEEIKDDILPFFIIDGDYIISKRVSEQLTGSNIKNINAKERARKAAEKRWGKNEGASSNATSIQQAINEQCSHNANQSQSQTFNNSSNYINEEDSFFLARSAQENQDPQKFEFEKIDRSVQNQIPTFEEAQAHCDYYQTKFKKKFDVAEWIAHWNAQNWIDKTNRPFDWRKKINDNSADPRFQIKEEKTPLKTFKEKDEENSERTFLLLEVGFQYKEKTTEELKEMVKQKRENDLIIAEQKREEQLAQIEAKKNEVVQIAPVKIKTQAELDEDYLYELRRDYGGAFANANKTLEEMLEIKRKKEEERNRPVKWFDQAKIEQAPTLDASLRDLYGNLLHNY